MTNELEKQFFDTFGIEPRYEDACTVEDKYWNNEELANEYGTFDQYMNCKCGNQENCTTKCSCAYQKEIYPQISDTHYLQLLCLLAKGMGTVTFFKDQDINNIKDTIVYGFILGKEYFTKHQVRTLFEEG